jgi:hypothetical protein
MPTGCSFHGKIMALRRLGPRRRVVRRSVRLCWAVLLASMFLIAGACSSDRPARPRYTYPERAIRFHDQNCSLDESEMCRCSLGLMQERLPYEDYRRFMFRNEDLPRTEWRRIHKLMNQINRACQPVTGASPAPSR